jgi:hypothetical protein
MLKLIFICFFSFLKKTTETSKNRFEIGKLIIPHPEKVKNLKKGRKRW